MQDTRGRLTRFPGQLQKAHGLGEGWYDRTCQVHVPKCYAQRGQDTLCTGELKTLGSPSTGTVKLQDQEVLGMLWKYSSKVEEMSENENGDYSVC